MPDFLIQNNFLMSTSEEDAPVVFEAIKEPRGVFSINASNQLQATFWLAENGQNVLTGISTASYVVYDKDGIAVGGMSQSGMTPDAQGQYHITPVYALIYDLTHYVVKVSIQQGSNLIVGNLGLTIGE